MCELVVWPSAGHVVTSGPAPTSHPAGAHPVAKVLSSGSMMRAAVIGLACLAAGSEP